MDKRIIAHRGASAYAPENTLEAFALAADMGAAAIEIDVHVTADNRLVVHHDANISRMTNGASAEFISKLTLDELKAFKFNGDFADKYPDATIPELSEVYTLMKSRGLWVNTEIKCTSDDPEIRKKNLSLILDCAAKCGFEQSVLYSAFSTENLIMLNELLPGVESGYLGTPPEGVTDWDFAKSLGCTAIHPQFKRITGKEYCDSCHALGLKIHPWTVYAKELRELLDFGVDAVITNYPNLIELAK